VDLKGPYLERTGCLTTEVVVSGFHWEDHRYLTREELEELFSTNPEEVSELNAMNSVSSFPRQVSSKKQFLKVSARTHSLLEAV
jgi:hypothetical protein